jgi:hypothetical protein
VIKNRISSFCPTDLPTSAFSNTPDRHNITDSSLLAHAVAAKLEEGILKAAVRIIASDDTPTLPSIDSATKLQAKHPTLTLRKDDIPDPSDLPPLSLDENSVRKAILSFPPGSTGGPAGLRPQHLKDLLQCRDSGVDFFSALTAFVKVVLDGRCPPAVAPFFFGGRLLALNKKDGGIRPLAIGMTPSIGLKMCRDDRLESVS